MMERLLHDLPALFSSAILVIGILVIFVLSTVIFHYFLTRPDRKTRESPDFCDNEAYLQ